MGDSELVDEIEGSKRAMSVLSRKCPSELSDGRSDSPRWSWMSVVQLPESVAGDGLSWEVVGSSWACRGVSAGRSGSWEISAWTVGACAFRSWRALLSSSQVSHFHCSRCVRP